MDLYVPWYVCEAIIFTKKTPFCNHVMVYDDLFLSILHYAGWSSGECMSPQIFNLPRGLDLN